MFKLEEAVKTIKGLGLEVGEYFIYMGGSMLIHDLREETHDLDVGLTTEAFERMMKRADAENGGWGKAWKERRGTIETEFGEVEFFDKGEKLDEGIITIEKGIACQKLEDILKMKEYLNREKDQKDIVKLRERLNKNIG